MAIYIDIGRTVSNRCIQRYLGEVEEGMEERRAVKVGKMNNILNREIKEIGK